MIMNSWTLGKRLALMILLFTNDHRGNAILSHFRDAFLVVEAHVVGILPFRHQIVSGDLGHVLKSDRSFILLNF